MQGPGTALRLALPHGGLNPGLEHLTLASVGMNIGGAPSGNLDLCGGTGAPFHTPSFSVAGKQEVTEYAYVYALCHRDLVYVNVCI